MQLSSLLLCHDDGILRVMRLALKDLDVGIELCHRADTAREMLSKRRFDAVVVECDQSDEHLTFLEGLKQFPYNKRAIVLAVTKDEHRTQRAREIGAHFVIQSPLSMPRLNTTLRAAKNLMNRERRRAFRKSVHSIVSFTRDHQEHFDAFILDVSQTGLAIKSTETLFERGQKVTLTFCLPATRFSVEIDGHVVWADGYGRTGISFNSVNPANKHEFERWLRERRRSARKAVPELSATITQPGAKPVRAILLDLGDGGVAIRSSERLCPGTTLRINIVSTSGPESIAAQGRVAWAHHSGAAGITFLSVSPELEQVVRMWTT